MISPYPTAPALLNSIAVGTARVSNFCVGDDRASMLRCLRGLGVKITPSSGLRRSAAKKSTLKWRANGLHGLSEPVDVLNAGNRRHHHAPGFRPAGGTAVL